MLISFVFLSALVIAGHAVAENEGNDNILPGKKMFNIRLSLEATELISQVEKGYGQSIREEEVLNFNGFGESLTSNSGRPVIRINPITGRNESTIVHEAFHLLLKLEGYPILAYEFPDNEKTSINFKYMKLARSHLYDGILHWVFYPRMKQIGVDTNEGVREQLEKAFRSDAFDNLNPAIDREVLAIYYAQAKLELNDLKLVNKITEWYISQGWIRPLKNGEKIEQIIIQENPQTPEASVAVFVECLNLLLQGSAYLKIKGWFERARGLIMEKVAIIQVLPSNRRWEASKEARKQGRTKATN